LSIGTQASADRRLLLSAALIGSGVGLGLGAAYMAGGMGQAVVDHSRAARIAEAAKGGFSDAVLLRQAARGGAGVLRLAREHDPAAPSADERDRRSPFWKPTSSASRPPTSTCATSSPRSAPSAARRWTPRASSIA
jgi:hypothetical protein